MNDYSERKKTKPFPGGGRYHIETSPFICSGNHWFLYDLGLRHERVKQYKNELTNRFQSSPNLQRESSGRSEFLHLHRCT